MVGEDERHFLGASVALGKMQSVLARRHTAGACHCEVHGITRADVGRESFVASEIVIADGQAIDGGDECENSCCGVDSLHIGEIRIDDSKDGTVASRYIRPTGDSDDIVRSKPRVRLCGAGGCIAQGVPRTVKQLKQLSTICEEAIPCPV
jgi:hypothetical protein